MILDFTAIDFETAYYRKESACSIGLVRFRDGEAVDSFYSLIRPPSLYVRPDFTAIHGRPHLAAGAGFYRRSAADGAQCPVRPVRAAAIGGSLRHPLPRLSVLLLVPYRAAGTARWPSPADGVGRPLRHRVRRPQRVGRCGNVRPPFCPVPAGRNGGCARVKARQSCRRRAFCSAPILSIMHEKIFDNITP